MITKEEFLSQTTCFSNLKTIKLLMFIAETLAIIEHLTSISPDLIDTAIMEAVNRQISNMSFDEIKGLIEQVIGKEKQTKITSESLPVSKQEFAVNVIGLGYAVERLSSITSLSKEVWAAEVSIEANRRLDELTEEQIERLIANHYTNESTSTYIISSVKNDELDCWN